MGQTFLEINNFRVHTISKFTGIEHTKEGIKVICEDIPKERGLAIEYKCGPENYIVITILKLNKDKEVTIEWVRNTVLTLEQDDLLDWQYVTAEAKNVFEGFVEMIEGED